MTAWTLTQTHRFRGVMVGAGLTNLYRMYSTNDLQTLGGESYPGDDVHERDGPNDGSVGWATPGLCHAGSVE